MSATLRTILAYQLPTSKSLFAPYRSLKDEDVMRLRLLSLLVAVVVTLSACGGDSTGPAVENGTLRFVLDQVTCPGSGNIELFVDATSRGTYAFTPGAQQSFTVVAGSHTAGAREIGGTNVVWPTTTVNVPANQMYSLSLTCQ